jgi:hypothetical protein
MANGHQTSSSFHPVGMPGWQLAGLQLLLYQQQQQ